MDLGVRVSGFSVIFLVVFYFKFYGLGKVLLSRNFGKVCG